MTVKTFISRPLLSLVISVFIVLLGVISLLSLPVERYPDIAPPAIYVWASYPGASAETVHKSVVMPLEEAMNGLSVTLFTTTLVFMVIFIPVAFVGGITREESQTSGRVIFIFLICIVFAYLVMVALYESLYIPLAVMLSVPFGLAGSLLFAKLFGVENNIYMQIGMVMLVGLLSKTAILLTEYASQARREGMSLAEAALRSAKVRLRPILMTSLTMIIGMLPLMFASGVGANGSRTIGVCVVGGMLFGTLGLLLTVPVLFVVFQKIQERIGKNRSHQ